MLKPAVLAIFSLAFLTTPAWPCELIGPPISHEGLIDRAKVVVRVRAEEGVHRPGPQGLFPVETQVRFRVLAVYKGKMKSDVIQFNGRLGPVATSGAPAEPYDFKRPRSFNPSCYNPGYQRGEEYLLFLASDQGIYGQLGDLTPYWAPMAPTNERVIGDADPWLRWVVVRIKGRR